ncbi:MAG: putative nucleotidyltransferase/DNA polymerase involved in repair [Parachlamydiales bacterium]|nr:putative nucleotidyltransferase/DNA polymerase involved in repair [Parachlamydiales bacterium]
MIFALADCNNFYASCEEVFNPKLSDAPLIILSNNDGCVIARSKKAKEWGVKMGDPAYLYKDHVERGSIQMLSSNFALYADMSHRVMQTLESYSPDMEIYSIDEAFFELKSSSDQQMGDDALQMRQKVKKWTGIPVSIGIGPTKTLAKIANVMAKKDAAKNGVCVLIDPALIRSQLEKTALEDIWGIGAALAQRLRCKQIYTAAQLIDCDDSAIKKWLGTPGYRTALELRGTPCFSCQNVPEKKKSIICSRSFKQAVTEKAALEEAIASFVSQAAEKLRSQKSLTAFLSVFIATSPFIQPYYGPSCHVDLPNPTAYTPELIRLAKECLHRIVRPGLEYKKAGVLIGHFTDKGTGQTDWLAPVEENPKKTRLIETIDKINRRYDKNAVRFAAEGAEYSWQSARKLVSPRYTTSWNELLIIH